MDLKSLQLINDRTELTDLPETLQSLLRSYGLVTTGGKKVSFCGLLSGAKNTYVFFPRKMSLNYNCVPDLFSAIRKYSMRSDSLFSPDGDGDNLLGREELLLVSEILTDYRHNGIYTRRQRLSKVNHGKPNWSKTLRTFGPYFSRKGPVYLDFVGSTSINKADSEASRVHAFLVKQLDSFYGQILFGFNCYSDDGLIPPQYLNEDYLLSILNSELQNLYSDRDIQLFNRLIEFVEKNYGKEKSQLPIGIKGFHTLWEHMLKSTIDGTVDINKEFSIPTYIHSNGNRLVARKKGQRTDIIVHDDINDVYAIVDAKYYQAADLKTAPGWSDLLKQFFYAKAVKSLRSSSRVKNYFIFPGDNQVLASAFMQKHNSFERDEDYEDIECIYLDPYQVIKAYLDESILSSLSRELVA